MPQGFDQVALFGVESRHGEAVLPTHTIGAVTGGTLREASEVLPVQTLAGPIPDDLEHVRSECEGEVRLLLSNLGWLAALWNAGRNPVPSFTMDIGANPAIRFVGTRVAEASVRLSLGEPVTIAFRFAALFATSGTVHSQPVPAGPFYVPEAARVTVAGTTLLGLQELTLRLSNGLWPVYLASPAATRPRAPAYLLSRTREAHVIFTALDRMEGLVRGLRPSYGPGATITILLSDLCGGPGRTITLLGCEQAEAVQPLVPAAAAVDFGAAWRVHAIQLS